MALPAILDYKLTEARCEKLPKLLPQLFSEVPEAEQLRRYAVLHQKHKQSLFDIFMELGGAPHGLPPALLPPSRLPLARPSARLPWLSLSYTCRQSHGQSHGQSHRQSHCQSHCCCCCCCCTRDAGFYYKTGQKIASNTGGVVPKVYSDI